MTMTYYPYGEPWSQPQGQPWLFGGKERERRHRLGDSDFGARTYNAARATFARPDPLAERYYPINPYTFCAADPINHIDPSGMDIYTLQRNGTFTLKRKTNDNFHTIENISGNRSINVERGFFTDITAQRGVNEAGDYVEYYVLQIFKMKQPGNDIFEFLARNSRVEWSRLRFKDGTTAIGTSHLNNGDATIGYYLDFDNDKLRYLTEFDHSHPDGSEPSKGDVSILSRIKQFSSSFNARIFNVPNNKYESFTSETKVDDSPILGECVVVGTRPHKENLFFLTSSMRHPKLIGE